MLRCVAGSVVLFLLLACLAPMAFCDEDAFQEVDREEFVALLESIMEANKEALSRIERGAGMAYFDSTVKGINAALQDMDYEESTYGPFRFTRDSPQHERYVWGKCDGIEKLLNKGFNTPDLWANYYDLRKHQAKLQEGKSDIFERVIPGEGFRPYVFLLTDGASLLREFHDVASERQGLAQGKTFRTAKLESGLLSLEWRMEPLADGWERFGRVTVDPARNNLLVSYEDSSQAVGKTGRPFVRRRYEMEWREYDGVMYPSRLFWERAKKEAGQPGERKLDITMTLEMRVDEFDPNPSIPDNASTLEGMNRQLGTRTTGGWRHVKSRYLYGATPKTKEAMGGLLDESDLDDDAEPAAQMAPSSDDVADSAAAHEKDASPVYTASAKWPVIIFIVAACLVIVLVLKLSKK